MDPHGIDIESSGDFYVADSLNFHHKERLRTLLANCTVINNCLEQ